MLLALIFPRAKRTSTYDISAERNVWLQSALRSFAIVCDYMETDLFAIVCDHMETRLKRDYHFRFAWTKRGKVFFNKDNGSSSTARSFSSLEEFAAFQEASS